MRYVLIGGGAMGSAMVRALLRAGCDTSLVSVVEKQAERRLAFGELGVRVETEANSWVGEAEVVVLAVKPQQAAEVCKSLQTWVKVSQVLVSIVAGVSVAQLREWTGLERVVRAMPNTPAQVNAGMSVYWIDRRLDTVQQMAVRELLESCGTALAVEEESLLDAATAISGSGPGYVFYLAECWQQAAEELGFSNSQAQQLVYQTLLGSIQLWKQSGISPQQLRTQVTSPGGTTEAAIASFERNKLKQLFTEGISQAYQRSQQLGAASLIPLSELKPK